MKFAKVTVVLFLKKKKVKISLVLNLVELGIDNDKLSTIDTSDTKGEFKSNSKIKAQIRVIWILKKKRKERKEIKKKKRKKTMNQKGRKLKNINKIE